MAFLFISLRMNGLFVSLVLGLRIVSNTRFPFFSALCLNICFSAAPTPIPRVLIEERRLCRFSDMICLHYMARQKTPLNVVIPLANNVESWVLTLLGNSFKQAFFRYRSTSEPLYNYNYCSELVTCILGQS